MRYFAAILSIGLAAGAVATAEKDAIPVPSVVPVSWELEFEYKVPQSITLRLPGDRQARRYWYLLYTVTNRSGKDRIFAPEMVLYTDTGKLYRAGDRVPSAVFTAIQKRHNNPLLIDMASITGRVLQGEDNARDGVVIWREFDPKARAFDVFIGGLSGERASIDLPLPITVTEYDPAGRPAQVKKTRIILQKTLHLKFFLPGEAAARSRTKPRLLKETWVMR